jgi:hypothetical protein
MTTTSGPVTVHGPQALRLATFGHSIRHDVLIMIKDR